MLTRRWLLAVMCSTHRLTGCPAVALSPNRLATSSLSLTLIVALFGCGQEVAEQDSSPSYADLVSIYNNELAALDRLEKKREELLARHEEQLSPSPEDALKALGDVLNSAVTSESQLESDADFDPNAMLDRASLFVGSS